MRLWHYKLIPYLPRQQLLGQHRECCAMRGLGWMKKHSVINYVWNYNYNVLFHYHEIVMDEMVKRGYKPNSIWRFPAYRGKKIGWDYSESFHPVKNLYKEHDDHYLQECIDNLKRKGITLNYTF